MEANSVDVYIYIFVLLFLKSFSSQSYQIIFKQIYLTDRWNLNNSSYRSGLE